MGAWIEIVKYMLKAVVKEVAPLVGAWIEILTRVGLMQQILSLLSWERGLKYTALHLQCRCITSLLSWERGLKYGLTQSFDDFAWSLLSWERGLKFTNSLHLVFAVVVAPLVGAWIEIFEIL